MGLKVYWDLPNVFEYFVATHQELESMRNRLFRPGRTPTMEEKVELGERFVSLLQQARERHTRRVKEALAEYCVEVRGIDPGEERMILKLACLVEKDRQAEWEEGVRFRPCSSTTTTASTTTAPGRLTTLRTWIWRLSYVGNGTPCFSWTTFSCAPIKGLAVMCRKVHDAAQEDLEQQEKDILATLAELHQLMDAGRIGDEDFNVRECDLLDRLEACQKTRGTDRRPPARWEYRRTTMEHEPVAGGETDNSVLELLDRVLNTGVVLVGEITITVADIELIYLRLQLMLSSAETARRLDGWRPGRTSTNNDVRQARAPCTHGRPDCESDKVRLGTMYPWSA